MKADSSTARDAGPVQGAHPSPHRDRVSPWAMWFCILGAPGAWSMQQLFIPPLFAHSCYPNDGPLAEPLWANAVEIAIGIELIAVVICALSTFVAWRSWRRTRNEKEGSGHHLLEAGDGRSRFMAMVGLICSVLFLMATVFAAGLIYMVHPCNG